MHLVSLDPPINGGTSRIGPEIAQMLIEKARRNPQLQIIFAVNDQFASRFIEWLGPGADQAPFIGVILG